VRLWDVSESLVDRVTRDHGRADLKPYIDAEAEAVPKGRFALLRACGFTLMMRVSPLRK
jgi:hypothetical protein